VELMFHLVLQSRSRASTSKKKTAVAYVVCLVGQKLIGRAPSRQHRSSAVSVSDPLVLIPLQDMGAGLGKPRGEARLDHEGPE
jgi:hypothetical protein